MSQTRYMPAALQALDDIADYTLKTWGQKQRDAYLGGLFNHCEALHASTRPAPIPKSLKLEGYVARYKRHRIYWRQDEQGDTIIVHILHERMLPEKHLYVAFQDLNLT